MKLTLLLLSVCTVARCQTPQAALDSLTVTISPQRSPYTLPKGLTLYAAKVCSSSTRVRVISAGAVIQVAESTGISVQDPSTIPLMVTAYVARSWQARTLTGISFASTGIAIGGASVAAFKTVQPNVGNARTWDIVSVASGVLGAAIPVAQKALQGDVAGQQASVTSGVKAALIQDYSELWTVPAGGCSSAVRRMFLGSGPVRVIVEVVK